jgi:hypothetical protein
MRSIDPHDATQIFEPYQQRGDAPHHGPWPGEPAGQHANALIPGWGARNPATIKADLSGRQRTASTDAAAISASKDFNARHLGALLSPKAREGALKALKVRHCLDVSPTRRSRSIRLSRDELSRARVACRCQLAGASRCDRTCCTENSRPMQIGTLRRVTSRYVGTWDRRRSCRGHDRPPLGALKQPR